MYYHKRCIFSGRRPRGRPRTRWRDYVSRLAWEHLGVPPEELEEVAGTGTSGFLCSSCCPHDPKRQIMDGWMDGWCIFSQGARCKNDVYIQKSVNLFIYVVFVKQESAVKMCTPHTFFRPIHPSIIYRFSGDRKKRANIPWSICTSIMSL